METRAGVLLAAALLVVSSGARAATPGGAGDDATAEIERRLDRKVTFEFVGTPITEALQFLQALVEATVVLDPQTPRKKWDSAVTLKVTDVPLRDALDQILAPAGLAFSIRDEALYVHEEGAREPKDEKPELSKALEARLARKVSFEFVETPFSFAIDFLQQLSGVTIEVPDAVAEKKGATPITLKVKNMRVGLAIEWMLKLADLGYEQRGDGLVCVRAGPAREAPRARVARPRPAFPSVMVVVDCARAADRNAARDLLAYLTRDRLPKGDPSRSVFGSFRLLPAASVAEAQKGAAKAGAFGIFRVSIVRRTPEARMRDSYLISTTCAFYTLATSGTGARPRWKLKASRRIANPSLWSGPPLVITSSDDFHRPGDPHDFGMIAGDIASLVRSAAVGFRRPRLARAPGGGHQLEIEVTSNTGHAISQLSISIGKMELTVRDDSGDPIPPGTKKVAMPIPEGTAGGFRGGNLSPAVVSVAFVEAAAK
ncbi:MAG: STN domain-containing protein [Planctomycetota bacterium]|jgi:hypothetical protein